MKKLLILITILLVLPLVLAIQTETSEDNTMRIDFIKSSPSPLAAGTEGELIFQITNLHTQTLKNLNFELADKFPISSPSKEKIVIDELFPQQTKEISFKVRTTAGAEDGTYTIGLQYYQPIKGAFVSAQFTIPVKTVSRAIASTLISTSPEKIPPGSKAKVYIDLQNGATYSMKDIVVKLNFTDTIPLAPFSSTSEKSIKILNPGESKLLDFDVIALPDATPNVYRLPITVTFDDELGSETVKIDEVGIIITSDPEYDLGIEDSQLIKKTPSELTLSISNIGTSNIKFLTLEVLPNSHYQTIKQSKEYIGNLEPDDFETAEFDVYPLKSGDTKLKIKLTYKDDLNQPIEEIKEIDINVYSHSQAKRYGLISGNGMTNYIIYILIIIFIYLTYKNWRRERNLPKAMKLSARRMLVFFLNILRWIKWKNIKRLPRKIRIALIKLR